MKKNFIVIWMLVLVLLFVTGCGGAGNSTEPAPQGNGQSNSQSSSDGVANFYKGKTIDFIVPFSPGGGYDTMARSIAPRLEKITGAKVLVKNVPGAGGNIGALEVFNAKPDGLTIGILNGGGAVFSSVLDKANVKYDLEKFSYICRISAESRVMTVSAKLNDIKKFEDFINSSRELSFGVTGIGEDLFYFLMGIKKAFNLPMKIVTGYEGQNQVQVAVLGGELDGTIGAVGSRIEQIKAGTLNPILKLGEDETSKKELSNVPSVSNFIKNDKEKEIIAGLMDINDIGRPIMAPGELPEEKRQFLQEAFKKALEDPELVKEWASQSRERAYMDGEGIKTLINKIFQNFPQALVQAYNDEIQSIKK